LVVLRDSPPNNIPIKFLNASGISDLIGALFERTSLTGQQPTLPAPYPLPFGSSLSALFGWFEVTTVLTHLCFRYP
jgi:hypothetical protein